MKIITYNVNGIRSAIDKGWAHWITSVNPDIICLQETKAQPEQLNMAIFEDMGYKHFWHSAQKKGYSGVAILTKPIPDKVEIGCQLPDYDCEGRIIRADYGNISVISAYFPSGSSGDERQSVKMRFLKDFQQYINKLKQSRPNLIIAGDYNICHQAIDIHNPVSNARTSGFLPEERAWMTDFIASGFTDSFRLLNKEPHHYTWWTFRANARARNLGWRIDYQMVSNSIAEKIERAVILPEAKHSDHCPMLLEIDV